MPCIYKEHLIIYAHKNTSINNTTSIKSDGVKGWRQCLYYYCVLSDWDLALSTLDLSLSIF